MVRLLTISSLLTIAAASIAQVIASSEAVVSLDDIEGANAARLMKNKEDIDAQSTYHENDIKGTGDVPDDLAARLVKNRGPITAKITASGSHSKYCGRGREGGDDGCTVNFSLVAWKFAGDRGTVHGMIEEMKDGKLLKVEVDCMVRNENEAIIGGEVKVNPTGKPFKRRAYVKVVDSGSDMGDFISVVVFDDGIGNDLQHCRTPGMSERFDVNYDNNLLDSNVSVCSKHGDWENCLMKSKIEHVVE